MAKKKITYQCNIIEYLQKREKYKRVFLPHDPKEYGIRTRLIQKRLNNWRRQVKRIEAKEEKLKVIEKLVFAFCGIKIRKIKTPDHTNYIARCLFYKFALERGIGGGVIVNFCNLRYPEIVTVTRKRFTKSFKTNEERYKIWKDFNDFVKRKEKFYDPNIIKERA